MKLILAVVSMFAVACSATAQVSSGSYASAGSQSIAGSSSGSTSSAQGGPSSASVTYSPTVVTPRSTTADNKVTYGGSYDIRNVPQVAAPSMGSGHPCGLGGSLGLAIVGGGATGGATRVDKACMLAQMGYTDAALYMYAAKDADVCRALVATGVAASASYCGASVATPIVGVSPQPRPAIKLAKCEKGPDNKVIIRYARGTDKAAAKAACLRSLGY